MSTHKVSKLFRYIEEINGDRPWGRFLDAGTGTSSMRWIKALDTTGWTVVTASRPMAAQIQSTVDASMGTDDRIVVGNWGDEQLLKGERFDTVLADYLLGAVEGYWPYGQGTLFQRLRPHVSERLYLVGVEPYVPFPSESEAGRLVRRIGSLRDACLLLAGGRPYREYPLDWVVHQLGQAGFRVIDARRFPNIYREGFINRQLDWSLRHIEGAGSETLQSALRKEVESLRQEALAIARESDGLRHGADYVVTASL